jgi:signal recognition particle subunit SRP54
MAMFENLSDKLELAFKTLKGRGRISEINIAETLKEVRRALIDADVHYKIAKEFTDEVKQKALGANVIKSVSPGQLMIKLVYDELKELMGGQNSPVNLKGNPPLILLSGLQGSGKTTLAAKLAYYYKKNGRNPLLVACDVYRPAAIEQIRVLGNQIEVDVYSEDSKDPLQIAVNALKKAKESNYSLVIVDTAGRLSIDEEMMKEISMLKKKLNPGETLFVVDSMTGQDAVNTAKVFNDVLDFDGVVLTKLDGDTRGGAALSVLKVVNKPIKFISIGEKPEALDLFHPERMANRILGMGDIVSFVEKAQEVFDEKEAQKMQKKIRKSQFDFNDLKQQLRQIKKMGNVKDLMSMIPGFNKMMKGQEIDDDAFKYIEAIIDSMTPFERSNPQVLDGKKKKRIAMGSGTDVQQINQLIKQLNEMKNVMKKMNKGGKMPKVPGNMPFMN